MPATEGIVDSLLHPPLAVTSPRLDTRGPYSGNNTLITDSDGFSVGDAFGVLLIATTIPPKIGRIGGYDEGGAGFNLDYFERPLAQVSAWYQFITGAPAPLEVEMVRYAYTAWMWQRALPTKIGLRVYPGVEMDLYFIKLL